MDKVKKLLVILFIGVISLGLTKSEATLYGNRIIICESGVVKDILVKYWHFVEFNEDPYIMDSFTRQIYPIKDCELYYCSPNPGRMKPCIIK